MNFPGAPLNFEDMRREGATPDARDGQKLVIGPWPHWVNNHRSRNGVDFGEHAIIELDDYITRFFDRWLKGKRNGIDDEKPVYIFVLGANEWWAEDSWPLPGTEEVPFYLHSGGKANSLKGDGGLSTAEPADEPADTYTYDPADPVRILWGLHDGPVDDRIPSTRDDVLCYTSEELSEPLDVVGWVTMKLWASSSALDTDWHVRLVDVYPDGSARFLCHGMLRARFRESFEKPELLEPGKPYLFEFTMDAMRQPLPARPPDPGRADELVVHAVRPQHQLGRGEPVHGRPARRGRPDRLPRRGALLARRPAGDPAVT